MSLALFSLFVLKLQGVFVRELFGKDRGAVFVDYISGHGANMYLYIHNTSPMSTHQAPPLETPQQYYNRHVFWTYTCLLLLLLYTI